jgi:hypothetical protein
VSPSKLAAHAIKPSPAASFEPILPSLVPLSPGAFDWLTVLQPRTRDRDALADIDMLADCDFLIVLLRSAVSRLALSLALGRKGKLPPFMSLQWPWSPNYHKRKFKAGKGAKMGKVPMKLGKLPMKVGRRVPPSGAKYRNRQDWLRDVVTQQKGAAA